MRKGVIIPIICVLLIVFLLPACSKKTAISAEDFAELMERKGFSVTDATDDSDDAFESVYTAISDDGYGILFIKFSSEKYARKFFERMKEEFDEDAGSPVSEISLDFGNSSYLEMSDKTTFYMVSRVDDTAVYTIAPVEFRGEIKDIVKELGY